MSRQPPATAPRRDDAVALISAYGAFRVLLVLLAVWTFFSGFALLTHAVGALSFGGDGPGDRVAGAQMLLLVPIYVLLVWRRDRYRLLLWMPYAAQLAVILPVILNFVVAGDDRDYNDGLLQLVVAFIFLVLLIYLWRESHPLGFFNVGEDEEEEWAAEDEEEYEEEDLDDEGLDEEEDEDVAPPRR